MKTHHLALIVALGFALPAAPLLGKGVEILQTMEMSGPEAPPGKVEILTKVKDHKLRMDMEGPMTGKASTIVDAKSGDVVTLLHDQKMFMKIPGGFARQLQQQQQLEDEKLPEFRPTGRSETIGGYKCKEYTAVEDGEEISVWISEEAPLSDSAMELLQGLEGDHDPFKGYFQMIEEQKGFPMRVVVSSPQANFRMEVTGIRETEIDSAAFVPPADYKTFEMPKELGEMLQGLE